MRSTFEERSQRSSAERTLHLRGCSPRREGVQLLFTQRALQLTRDTLHPGRCLLGLLPSERRYGICQEVHKLSSVATNSTQSSE